MADGGIGEAALLGAALGGGSSMISGRDPLQGALLGGLLGGAGGAFGGGAAGAEAGLAGGAEGAFSAATPTGLAAVPGDIGVVPSTGGISSLLPQTLGGKIAAGTAGLGALAMLGDRKKYGMPDPQEYTGPLSKFKYDPATYQPYVYKPYADGGPVEAMSNANSIGQNTGFPQADIRHGAYATPWQTPVSRNMLEGAADTGVNPISGEMNFASGGGIADLGGYSDGGRLLKGPGDGVSDSIPAVIGGKQPARLADGEFVVPARIVSEIGNGSTDAGARELYKMMDRVQSARGKTTGKGKMAKNTRAAKYLPA